MTDFKWDHKLHILKVLNYTLLGRVWFEGSLWISVIFPSSFHTADFKKCFLIFFKNNSSGVAKIAKPGGKDS